MPLNIRADTTEYYKATFTADHDTTGDVVEVALWSATGGTEVWHGTTVLSTVETPPASGKWVCSYRILIGPNGGDVSLAPGNYIWLLRITDYPEQPVRQVDTVTVT